MIAASSKSRMAYIAKVKRRRAAEALCADLTISDPFKDHTPESVAKNYPEQVAMLAEGVGR